MTVASKAWTSLLLTFTLALLPTKKATAAPGDAAATFNPNVNGEVRALALQPDGQMVIGGSFTTVGGVARNHVARLSASGALDPTFIANAGVNSVIFCIAIQPNGQILVGGNFTTIGGVARNYLARLNANGTVDPSFNPNANGSLGCMVLQPDGRLLIGGSFTTVGGISRSRLARLHPDGSLDLTFNASLTQAVVSMALQGDKILVGGRLSNTAGWLNRLQANGTLDDSFSQSLGISASYYATPGVYAIRVLPDGKILVGGGFNSVQGISRNNLARLNDNGSLDLAYNPNLNEAVRSLALQADGKLIATGYFTSVGGTTRNKMARILPDGSLDTTFLSNIGNVSDQTVYAAELQKDGRVVTGGRFSTVNGLVRNNLARLDNDAATENLLIPALDHVNWPYAGTLPEPVQVDFDWSTDGGSTWILLGKASRVVTGWELAGPGLPASGQLRARARTATGYGNGSSSLIESTVSFGPFAVPEILVRGNGSEIPDGKLTPEVADGTDFEAAEVRGAAATKTFVIENSGTAGLTLYAQPLVTVMGENAGDFLVTVPPAASVLPTGSSSFQITFNARGLGLRQARVRILNNDSDEGSYEFVVQGTGTGLVPEIAVSGNGVNITQGDLAPSAADHTDFGSTGLTDGTSVIRTYTISNLGTSALALTGTPRISITGHATDFLVSLEPATSVPAGGGTTLQITFRPTSVGLRSAVVRISSDDDDEPLFDFAIQGTALPRGALDDGFDGSSPSDVYSLAVQPDGKILLGDLSPSGGGAGPRRLARLERDGTLDATFTPKAIYAHSIAVQSDGKIVVGGFFSAIDGIPRTHLARLHADGTVDAAFNPSVNGTVYSIALQENGAMLVAGNFKQINATPRNYIARVLADGSLDPDFNPDASATINHVSIQPDGRILLGGKFTSINRHPRNRLARLHPDGRVDESFNPNVDGEVYGTLIQPDGRIVFYGSFSNVGGQARSSPTRINANGTLEPIFNFS